MSDYLDYTPVKDGAAYDPEPNGGQVTTLRLYGTPDRDGAPVVTVGPAVRVEPFVYRFTFAGAVDPGRYWTEVVWTAETAGATFTDTGDRVDLPFDLSLIVSPEDVATKLGVQLPITAAQRETLIDAILDAQGAVEAFLNRSLVPFTETLAGVYPRGYDLDSWKSWPVAQFNDKVQVLGHVSNGDGSYDVTVKVGLDGRAELPIRRFVRVQAAESVRQDPATGMGTRTVSSVSADGQSVSYERDYSTADGAAGSTPNISSLRRYKRHAVYRRPTRVDPRWPYAGSTGARIIQ